LDEHDNDPQDFGPSRSQRRRDALAVLGLAEQLVAMTPNRLQQIDLPDDVRAEVDHVRGIRAYGARKRQMAYLAKLMRRHDEDAFDAARAALGENREERRREHAAMQRLETLRERLLEDGDEALAGLIAEHPDIDSQHLRSLIRRAKAERAADKPPRLYRELFRALRDIVDD